MINALKSHLKVHWMQINDITVNLTLSTMKLKLLHKYFLTHFGYKSSLMNRPHSNFNLCIYLNTFFYTVVGRTAEVDKQCGYLMIRHNVGLS